MKQLIGILALAIGLYACNNGSGSTDTSAASYQEKVQTIEEIERADPVQFLNASGTYNENFFGTKLKVHGVIKNNATVATYKDAVVRVTYYSATQTILGTNDYTVYDFFPPSSEKTFEMKIENYKNVSTIGWDVINAVAN